MTYSERVNKIERINTVQLHEELIYRLFGSNPESLQVSRSRYTEELKKIQDENGLKQGHPDFLEWVFTCVGRSPIIIDDEEKGAGHSEPTTEDK